MTTTPEDQIPDEPIPPADATPPADVTPPADATPPVMEPPQPYAQQQQPYAQPQQPYGQPPVGAYPPSPAWAGQVPAGPPLRPDEERLWSTLAHVGGIVASFVAPLVIWLVFKDRSRFTDDQAKEALNFQITVAIGYVVGTILTVILIGVVILFAVWVATLVFCILGAVSANQGKPYRYPICIRLIK